MFSVSFHPLNSNKATKQAAKEILSVLSLVEIRWQLSAQELQDQVVSDTCTQLRAGGSGNVPSPVCSGSPR